jgi:predicted TIM-barrel fold metal-dependent hydrolase
MYKGYRYIDSDSHVLEPPDIWDNYLEPAFRDRAPKTIVRYEGDPPVFHQETHVGGHSYPDWEGMPGRGIFPVPGLDEVYHEYIRAGFAPESYALALDTTGMDYMTLFPTAALTFNAVPNHDPALAAAYCRAYNNWLRDFCGAADRRVLGVGTVDLRDLDEAVREVRRCVKELGFKAIQINPEPVPDYPPLYRADHYAPLWSALEELDVPLGVHLAPITKFHVGGYYFPKWSIGSGISAFVIGNMLASLMLIMGGALEKHPRLRVAHLEAGCGWVAFWLDRMQAGVLRSSEGSRMPYLSMKPVEYFQRQCFVSADPGDPWIRELVDAVGDDCITTASDFGHPEGKGWRHAIDEILALPGVREESKRKIMWDNPARLFGIAVD